jgi:hypothetical protein
MDGYDGLALGMLGSDAIEIRPDRLADQRNRACAGSVTEAVHPRKILAFRAAPSERFFRPLFSAASSGRFFGRFRALFAPLAGPALRDDS